MANTTYGVNHPLAVKLWAKELFHEALKQTWFGRFIGNDSNSLIQVKTETQKGPGDRIRVGLRMLLTGAGIQGDDTLEGNEEALVTYTQDTLINQLRHAVRSAGKMSEQRVPFDVRAEAKQGLADWWAQRMEVWLANQLTGNTAQTDTRFTGNNLCVAPDTAHIVLPQSATLPTSEASISATTSHVFSLSQIDVAVNRARTGTPRIRPISVDGGEYYVAFIHPNQTTQLRQATQTGQWVDLQKAAMAGMDSHESPIFTGALGIYNQTILHECPYLPSFSFGQTTSGYRAVFCGAQAAVMAYGQDNSGGSMSWNEKLFDYGNQLGVMAGLIAGAQKTNYNSLDFAAIVMSSYSPSP